MRQSSQRLRVNPVEPQLFVFISLYELLAEARSAQITLLSSS